MPHSQPASQHNMAHLVDDLLGLVVQDGVLGQEHLAHSVVALRQSRGAGNAGHGV